MSLNSQQHDFPNVNETRMTPIDNHKGSEEPIITQSYTSMMTAMDKP